MAAVSGVVSGTLSPSAVIRQTSATVSRPCRRLRNSRHTPPSSASVSTAFLVRCRVGFRRRVFRGDIGGRPGSAGGRLTAPGGWKRAAHGHRPHTEAHIAVEATVNAGGPLGDMLVALL